MSWPTTPTPNKDTHVTARLSPEESHELTVAARTAGVSKSAFVRRCVKRCIEHDKKVAARLQGKET